MNDVTRQILGTRTRGHCGACFLDPQNSALVEVSVDIERRVLGRGLRVCNFSANKSFHTSCEYEVGWRTIIFHGNNIDQSHL